MAKLGRVSRIDWAKDDCPIDVSELADMWQKGYIRTKLRNACLHRDLNTNKQTIYIGSRQSEKFVRIYDERGPVRVEFEIKGKPAHNIGKVFAETGEELWEACSNGILRVCKSTDPHNKELDKRWEDFVGSAAKADFPRTEKSTLVKTVRWLKQSVEPTRKAVLEALDNEAKYIDAPMNSEALAYFMTQTDDITGSKRQTSPP